MTQENGKLYDALAERVWAAVANSAGPNEVTAVLRSAVSQLLDKMKHLQKFAIDYQDDPSEHNLRALVEEVISETEGVIGTPMPF